MPCTVMLHTPNTTFVAHHKNHLRHTSPFLTAVRPASFEIVHAFLQQLTTPPIFPYKPLLIPFLLLLVPVLSGRLRARWLRLRRPSLPKHAPAPSASSRFHSGSSVPGTQLVQSPPIMNI